MLIYIPPYIYICSYIRINDHPHAIHLDGGLAAREYVDVRHAALLHSAIQINAYVCMYMYVHTYIYIDR